ncbi:DHA2 family efflux MFS transporter permease subunit, partial [Streptomyces sp. NRRL F-5008]|uniref:DHA2 family efflux MFS transporter permease subunit n=1 Tax=Streptomyces antibioticus TaxID=1890 RepID=UPI0004CC5499
MSAEPSPQARRHNPWLVLAVLCASFFMTLLDTTIVTIAIPEMAEGLGASLDDILWFANAYMLVFAALLLLSGRLGDRFGAQRTFTAGLAVFTVASAVCGFVDTPGQMIAARAVQGLGAAVMMPQTLALISAVFPAERRGAAFGVWSAVAGLATVAGPTVGGALVSGLDWRWIFFINVPIGAAALVGALVVVPDVRTGQRTSLDLTGAVLSTAGLSLIVYGLIEGERYDWGTIESFLSIPLVLALGVALLGLFALHQRARQDRRPLVPFELFRSRGFTVSATLGAMLLFGSIGVLLPLTLYLQSVLGLSAGEAGLALVPGPLVSLFVAPVAGNAVGRLGGRKLLVPGLLVFGAGIALTAVMAQADSSVWAIIPGQIVFGVGMGLVFAPTSTLAMQEIPPRLTGVASGMFTTFRQIGAVVGAAAVGALLQNRLAAEGVPEEARQQAGRLTDAAYAEGLTDAVRYGLFLTVAVAVVAAAVALLLPPAPPRPEPETPVEPLAGADVARAAD